MRNYFCETPLSCKCNRQPKQTKYQIMDIQFSKINPMQKNNNLQSREKKKGFNCFRISVSAWGQSRSAPCPKSLNVVASFQRESRAIVFYSCVFWQWPKAPDRIPTPFYHIVRLKCELLLFGIRSIDDGYVCLFDRSALKKKYEWDKSKTKSKCKTKKNQEPNERTPKKEEKESANKQQLCWNMNARSENDMG